MILVDVLLPLLKRFGGDVLEYFELVLRLADDGTQGDSDGQAYHASAGDAHAHGVFEDVGAFDVFTAHIE